MVPFSNSVHPGEGRGPDGGHRPLVATEVFDPGIQSVIWTPAFAGVHGEGETVKPNPGGK